MLSMIVQRFFPTLCDRTGGSAGNGERTAAAITAKVDTHETVSPETDLMRQNALK
jgi:hypothetical protein